MYLASSLELNGPKSASHYIVLQHDSRSDLARLPKSYQDLEREVKDLYGINSGEFFVETNTLNLCRGKRVRIPGVVWADIAQLLVSIFIVRCEGKSATQGRSEPSVKADIGCAFAPSTEGRRKIEEPKLPSDTERGSVPNTTCWPIQFSFSSQDHDVITPKMNGRTSVAGATQGPFNVQFVVPTNANPESPPKDASVLLSKPRHINLSSPFVEDRVLVITLGPVHNSTPSNPFSFRLLDRSEKNDLDIQISPATGKVAFGYSSCLNIPSETSFLKDLSFNSVHYIIIFKQGRRLVLLFDHRFVASAVGPLGPPPYFNAVTFDIEAQSLFKGQIAANVFPNLIKTLGPPRPLLARIDREALFGRILACDRYDAMDILNLLSAIRTKESPQTIHGSSAVKHSLYTVRENEWTRLNWDVQPRCMLVIQYSQQSRTLSVESPVYEYWTISFGKRDSYSLLITMDLDWGMQFGEHSADGSFSFYHRITLSESVRSPGNHSIALFNEGGKIHLVCDFKMVTVLPRATLLTRKPESICCRFSGREPAVLNGSVELIVYDFGLDM